MMFSLQSWSPFTTTTWKRKISIIIERLKAINFTVIPTCRRSCIYISNKWDYWRYWGQWRRWKNRVDTKWELHQCVYQRYRTKGIWTAFSHVSLLAWKCLKTRQTANVFSKLRRLRTPRSTLGCLRINVYERFFIGKCQYQAYCKTFTLSSSIISFRK